MSFNTNKYMQGIINHSDRVKQIARPLLDHFGISYFYHYLLDNDGNFYMLMTNPEIEEYYLNEKLFLLDPHLKHPSNYRSGFLPAESLENTLWNEALRAFSEKFHLKDCITLALKNDCSVEFFGFWGKKNVSFDLKALYFNEQKLLRSFALHFKKEMGFILQTGNEPSIPYGTILGENFYAQVPSFPLTQRIRSYLLDLGLEDLVIRAESLSPREIQCLEFIANSKSVKEIAAILRLSPRTIESYIGNLKKKLSCWSKQELYSIGNELQKFGFIGNE